MGVMRTNSDPKFQLLGDFWMKMVAKGSNCIRYHGDIVDMIR